MNSGSSALRRPAGGIALVTMLLVAAVPAAAQRADTEGAVDDLVTTLLPDSPPPGRKDIESTLRPFRVGPALWDTGETRGGYHAKLAELVDDADSENYEFMETFPTASAGSTPIDGTVVSGKTTVNGIGPPIAPFLFGLPFARFSFEGDDIGTPAAGGDFGEAFGGSLANFFSTQNTVFSPVLEACGTPPCFGLYASPSLTDALAPLAVGSGLSYAQNIGFANHPAFATGHYELAARYPLITKFDVSDFGLTIPTPTYPVVPTDDLPSFADTAMPPMLSASPELFYEALFTPYGGMIKGTDLSAATGLPAGFPTSFANKTQVFRNIAMSMVHPEVAALLELDIAARVEPGTVFTDGLAYSAIGGEYFIGLGDHEAPFSFSPPTFELCGSCDPSTADGYFDALSDTDYSVHSYDHFKQWLDRRYGGSLSALAGAWGWSAVGDCVTDGKTFAECEALDPLLDNAPAVAKGQGANLAVIHADWTAFQREQFLESQSFQYDAAVRSVAEGTSASGADMDLVDDSLFFLQFDTEGVDLGALRSDGVALGHWYAGNDQRTDPLSPMKQRALHAGAYGESLNFPLFGLPRDKAAAVPSCEAVSQDGELPTTFRPRCLDFDFSMRTLNEFLTLGVDSLGIAYWENVAFWSTSGASFSEAPPAAPPAATAAPGVPGGFELNLLGLVQRGADLPPLPAPAAFGESQMTTIKNSVFGPGTAPQNVLQVMAEEVDRWRAERAFMTPWRSPLLIHTGEAVDPLPSGSDPTPYDEAKSTGVDGLAFRTLRALAADHAQFAPFAAREGLDDMWLTSERELMLSPFVPDLDTDLVQHYVDAAEANGFELMVMTDMATFADVVADLALTPETCTLQGASGCGQAVLEDSFNAPIGFLYGFDVDTAPMQDAVEALLDGNIFDIVEAATATTIRPVRVVPPSTCTVTPLDPATIDLTVATDGLNFLVCATNTSALDQTFGLVVDAALPDTNMIDTTGDFCLLGEARSEVHFLRPEDAFFTDLLDDVNAALIAANVKKINLETALFDTRAAQAVIDELQYVWVDSTIEVNSKLAKVVAGLLRLERMPFLYLDPGTDELFVSAFDLSPIADARVQLELPLQRHARRDDKPVSLDPLVTNNFGRVFLDDGSLDPFGEHLADGGDGNGWDFAAKEYDRPDLAEFDTHVVRVEVQHPVYASQAALTVDLTPEVCEDTWTDLRSALTGIGGMPVLDWAGGYTPVDPIKLTLENALPNVTAFLFIGDVGGAIPFLGGTLTMSNVVSQAPFTVGLDGTTCVAFPAPVVPAGSSLYFQFWIADPSGPMGFTASNGVEWEAEACGG